MVSILSNQSKKGDVYYGVRLYKNGKYIGSHNGSRLTKKINWFIKLYIDMFIDELIEKSKEQNIKVVIDKKVC